jgi:LmbE family N-acetylglucosaminyl deacetylase
MKVLVVAAHPDDEILGCGGAMARHVGDGDEVHVMIMAEGLTSRSGFDTTTGKEELAALRAWPMPPMAGLASPK